MVERRQKIIEEIIGRRGSKQEGFGGRFRRRLSSTSFPAKRGSKTNAIDGGNTLHRALADWWQQAKAAPTRTSSTSMNRRQGQDVENYLGWRCSIVCLIALLLVTKFFMTEESKYQSLEPSTQPPKPKTVSHRRVSSPEYMLKTQPILEPSAPISVQVHLETLRLWPAGAGLIHSQQTYEGIWGWTHSLPADLQGN